ncbi:MAG: PDZ domain-containing protein [Nodularia sp. CChRGM 3473]
MKLVYALSTTLFILGVVKVNAPAVGSQLLVQQTAPVPSSEASPPHNETELSRPYVGIQMVSLTPEIAQRVNSDPNTGFKVTVDKGVLIAEVTSDTPAVLAGLRPGDVIVEVENQPVSTSQQVAELVANSQKRQSLSFKIQRDNQQITVPVGLEEWPTSQN